MPVTMSKLRSNLQQHKKKWPPVNACSRKVLEALKTRSLLTLACALNGHIFKCVICQFIHYSFTRYLQLGISRFQFEKTTPGWGEQLAIGEHRYGDTFQSITFACKNGTNEINHPGLHLTPLMTAASVFMWNNDRHVWEQPTFLSNNYLLDSRLNFMSSPVFIAFLSSAVQQRLRPGVRLQ